MKFLIRAVVVCLLLACVGMLVMSIVMGHQKSLDLFISSIHAEFYSAKIHDLIQVKLFHLIQLVIVLPILGLSFLLFYFNKIYTYLVTYSTDFYNSIKFAFRNIASTKGKYVLILPIIVSIYFALTIPVSYDEALTYAYFTSKGIFTSISFYPVPNNHVLNSITTNLTSHIPFSTVLFNLRISSIIFNFFTWVIAFSFLSKYFSKNVALVVVAIASTLFFSIYYSYMARGYGMLNLFFVTALYFTFNIIKGGNLNRNWFWFSMASILGFYTIPTFLYPFITLNLLILLNGFRNIKKQFIANIAIVCCVVALYLPIVVVSGLKALVSNEYVAPINRITVMKSLPAFLTDSMEEISGLSWIVIIVLLSASLIFLLYKKEKKSAGVFLVFIAMPAILLVAHSVIPFGRTFAYYAFIIVCLFCVPWTPLLNKVKPAYLLPILMLIQLGLIYNFNNKIEGYEDYSYISKNILQQMNIKAQKITSDAERFNILLLFKASTEHLGRESVDCRDGRISADTLYNRDFIILEKWEDQTKIKVPKISNKYYNVY